jgi:hypothetical protein
MKRLAATLLLAALPAGAPTPAPAAAAPGPEVQGAEEITPRLVAAVGRGLEYLAQAQQRDGSWTGDVGFKLNQDYRIQETGVPHVGVTALCGMAFLAGGHLPDRGKYGTTLDRAITFLLGQVNDQGFITAHHTRMYDHAFATLFLAEVFGQTNRGDVRAKLQQAVDLIVSSQNVKGSWRYEPFALESDMSITVCQLMALRAARNVGIKVSKDTIKHAIEYVLASQVHDDVYPWQQGPDDYYMMGRGAFKYQYQEEGDMSRSSFALTAAGITSLYHAAEYDTRRLKDSLNFLEESMERVSRPQWRTHFFYWYGHYYAVQAMFITGNIEGPDGRAYWTRYWRHISGELLEQGGDFGQGADGSWPNTYGPGRNFATAIALIVLQTPYRYLPILQR